MGEKITAGDTVMSFCSKCNSGIDHTVVAMEGSTIAKVVCKTCGGRHKFRDPASAKKARVSRKKPDPLKTAEALWETCLAAAKSKERMYIMSARYRVGDVVLHDIFGKGVVRKLCPNKCFVLFKDKERLMASANQ